MPFWIQNYDKELKKNLEAIHAYCHYINMWALFGKLHCSDLVDPPLGDPVDFIWLLSKEHSTPIVM